MENQELRTIRLTGSERKGLVTCVCVEVVPQQSNCSEGPSTQVTFMGPLVCVALHVPIQVGAPWAGVATELTLESLLHTFR